jgi:DNA-binding response OmpR family regulator
MLRDLRVLLVEDDPEVARTVERVLARYGHTCTMVSRIQTALDLDQCFDCGVFDIDLPDGSGVVLAKRLLDGGRLGAVVFFSASTDAEVQEQACEFGPFVAKSAGTRELEQALSEAVSCVARQVAGGGPGVEPSRHRRTESGSRRKATGGQ